MAHGKVIGDGIGAVLSFILGIAFWGFTALATLIVVTIYTVISLIFTIGTTVENKDSFIFITPINIFRNEIPILDVALFIDPSVAEKAEAPELAITISAWYRVVLLISIGFMFAMLLYLCIKYIVKARTSDKLASVKEGLTNWFVAMLTMFSMIFIAVVIIKINSFFVNILSEAIKAGTKDPLPVGKLIAKALIPNIFTQIAAIILIGLMLRYTLMYISAYLKRLLKTGFLILIAPLVAIQRVTQKGAINEWVRTFATTVLVQIFHMLIFVQVLAITRGGIESGNSLSIFRLCVIVASFKFIQEAEQIVKNLFQIKDGVSLSDGDNNLTRLVFMKKGIDMAKNMAGKNYDPDKDRKLEQIKLKGRESEPKGNENPKQKLDNVQNEQKVKKEEVKQTEAEQKAEKQLENVVESVDSKQENVFKKGLKTAWSKAAPLRQSQNIVGGALGLSTYALTDNYSSAIASGYAGLTIAQGVKRRKQQRDEYRKYIYEKSRNYEKNTKDTAEKVSNALKSVEEVTGMTMNAATVEGKANLQTYIQNLKEKMNNGELIAEYNKAAEEFSRYLQEQKGMTKMAADIEVSKKISEIKSGEYTPKYDSPPEEKALATTTINIDVAQKLDSFQKENAIIGGDLEDVVNTIIQKDLQNDANRMLKSSGKDVDTKVIESSIKEIKRLRDELDKIELDKTKLEETLSDFKDRGIDLQKYKKEYIGKVTKIEDEMRKIEKTYGKENTHLRQFKVEFQNKTVDKGQIENTVLKLNEGQ